MSAADKAKLDGIPPGGGGGGVDTVGNVGNTPNAGGASISGDTISLQPADATNPGVVVPGTQNLGAAKTISGAILNGITTIAEAVTSLVRAVGVSLVLRSDRGALSADVAVKIGTSVSDGSTHATSEIAGVYTGLGGSEVKVAGFQKQALVFPRTFALKWDNGGGNSWQIEATPNGGGSGVMRFGNNGSRYMALRFVDGYTETSFGFEVNPTGSAPVTKLWGSLNPGRIDQAGTDASGSPGAVTIHKPIGKAAIAAGASSVVITNSMVSAGMHCIISPHARDATCKELIAVCSAGAITVSGSANATAPLPFSFEVKGML